MTSRTIINGNGWYLFGVEHDETILNDIAAPRPANATTSCLDKYIVANHSAKVESAYIVKKHNPISAYFSGDVSVQNAVITVETNLENRDGSTDGFSYTWYYDNNEITHSDFTPTGTTGQAMETALTTDELDTAVTEITGLTVGTSSGKVTFTSDVTANTEIVAGSGYFAKTTTAAGNDFEIEFAANAPTNKWFSDATYRYNTGSEVIDISGNGTYLTDPSDATTRTTDQLKDNKSKLSVKIKNKSGDEVTAILGDLYIVGNRKNLDAADVDGTDKNAAEIREDTWTGELNGQIEVKSTDSSIIYYQWYRKDPDEPMFDDNGVLITDDGGVPREINGETDGTYVITGDDASKMLYVFASTSDDLGTASNITTSTSRATYENIGAANDPFERKNWKKIIFPPSTAGGTDGVDTWKNTSHSSLGIWIKIVDFADSVAPELVVTASGDNPLKPFSSSGDTTKPDNVPAVTDVTSLNDMAFQTITLEFTKPIELVKPISGGLDAFEITVTEVEGNRTALAPANDDAFDAGTRSPQIPYTGADGKKYHPTHVDVDPNDAYKLILRFPKRDNAGNVNESETDTHRTNAVSAASTARSAYDATPDTKFSNADEAAFFAYKNATGIKNIYPVIFPGDTVTLSYKRKSNSIIIRDKSKFNGAANGRTRKNDSIDMGVSGDYYGHADSYNTAATFGNLVENFGTNETFSAQTASKSLIAIKNQSNFDRKSDNTPNATVLAKSTDVLFGDKIELTFSSDLRTFFPATTNYNLNPNDFKIYYADSRSDVMRGIYQNEAYKVNETWAYVSTSNPVNTVPDKYDYTTTAADTNAVAGFTGNSFCLNPASAIIDSSNVKKVILTLQKGDLQTAVDAHSDLIEYARRPGFVKFKNVTVTASINAEITTNSNYLTKTAVSAGDEFQIYHKDDTDNKAALVKDYRIFGNNGWIRHNVYVRYMRNTNSDTASSDDLEFDGETNVALQRAELNKYALRDTSIFQNEIESFGLNVTNSITINNAYPVYSSSQTKINTTTSVATALSIDSAVGTNVCTVVDGEENRITQYTLTEYQRDFGIPNNVTLDKFFQSGTKEYAALNSTDTTKFDASEKFTTWKISDGDFAINLTQKPNFVYNTYLTSSAVVSKGQTVVGNDGTADVEYVIQNDAGVGEPFTVKKEDDSPPARTELPTVAANVTNKGVQTWKYCKYYNVDVPTTGNPTKTYNGDIAHTSGITTGHNYYFNVTLKVTNKGGEHDGESPIFTTDSPLIKFVASDFPDNRKLYHQTESLITANIRMHDGNYVFYWDRFTGDFAMGPWANLVANGKSGAEEAEGLGAAYGQGKNGTVPYTENNTSLPEATRTWNLTRTASGTHAGIIGFAIPFADDFYNVTGTGSQQSNMFTDRGGLAVSPPYALGKIENEALDGSNTAGEFGHTGHNAYNTGAAAGFEYHDQGGGTMYLEGRGQSGTQFTKIEPGSGFVKSTNATYLGVTHSNNTHFLKLNTGTGASGYKLFHQSAYKSRLGDNLRGELTSAEDTTDSKHFNYLKSLGLKKTFKLTLDYSISFFAGEKDGAANQKYAHDGQTENGLMITGAKMASGVNIQFNDNSQTAAGEFASHSEGDYAAGPKFALINVGRERDYDGPPVDSDGNTVTAYDTITTTTRTAAGYKYIAPADVA